MKPSLLALSLVGLATAGLWYFAGGANPPAATASDTPRVAAPLTHENLSVYFVYGPDTVPDAKLMSLQEALERELAVVHETSSVNVLAVENKSPDTELFIQSGDIVKGGKQDRMAQMDMLLPPNSGVVPLPAHCVEQGRWTNRGAEDTQKFKSSGKRAVGNDMKIANYGGQQAAVWQTVGENQGKVRANVDAAATTNASPTSFQLTLESPALQAKVAEYEAALKAAGEDQNGVVGVVFAVNGQVTGAEVYGSNALFRKAWPKLLNAAAVEAVAERTEKLTAGPPSARAVEIFLARGADAEPAESIESGESNRSPNADRYAAAGGRARLRDFYGVRGHAVNANEEFFQTEGRAPNANEPFQTEGRAPATSTGQFILGGSVNSDAGLVGNVQTAAVVQTQTIARARTRVSLNDAQRPNLPPIPTPAPPGFNPALAPATAVVLSRSGAGQAEPQPLPAPPTNPTGNRLNSNQQENRSTLVVESRDPARKNVVIHRSYLKK